MDGTQLPKIVVPPAGPISQQWIDRLARTECPAITARRDRRTKSTGVGQDPVVWVEAKGANVKDADGNIFVDLTSGFGVASLGHRPTMVVDAIREQTDTLMHAMGDVFPSDAKIQFSEQLAEFCPGNLQYSILGLNGSDAVAAALKTAVMATGNPGVIAFEDSYHGLFYGPLAVSGYKAAFRDPFKAQLNPHVYRVRFPNDGEQGGVAKEIKNIIARHSVGAILIEPILGRGGERCAPPGFLQTLRAIADRTETVLIFDEIWTGLFRTGERFACDHDGVVPDVMCLGKSLGGGLPLSAAIGTPGVMKQWGRSSGEAIHTSTFLGHPVSCAAGSAVLRVLGDPEISDSIARRAEKFSQVIRSTVAGREVRGRGWLLGVNLGDGTVDVWRALLNLGYLTLPSGPKGEILALTPPFVITEAQIDGFANALASVLT